MAGGCGLWRCLCRSFDGRSDTLDRPGLASSIRAQASQPITEAGGRRAEARLHVSVPVGVQPSAGTGAGRRGTLGRNTGGVAASAMAPSARPCMGPFLRFRARGVTVGRSNSLTHKACRNRRRAYGEGLRLPFINWERYPEDSPHWRANSFWDLPSRPSNSHTASRLSFTLGRRRRVGFISSVPSPRVATTARRGIRCILPGKRPTQHAAAASPARPCVRAFPLPIKRWAAARNRSILVDRRRSAPNRRTASCRLWRRWLPRRHSP